MSKLKREKPVFNFFADLGEKIVSPFDLSLPNRKNAALIGAGCVGFRMPDAIRPLAPEELDLVERHIDFDWGNPAKHRERLARQGEGDVVYLVAWIDDLPIGHVLIEWGGTTDEPVRTQLADCADLQDLFVAPDYRRRGVGSSLLDDAEDLVTQKGFPRLGLGAAVDNRDARRLYQRKGFRDGGFGEYRCGGVYIDRDGSEQAWEETCEYMIKQLGSDGSA